MINNEVIQYKNTKIFNTNTYRVPAEMYEAWVYELTGSNNPKMLSKSDKHRIALASQMYSLQCEGRTLIHMSITYKLIAGQSESSENLVNNIYKSFYTRKFLPFLLGTNKFHTTKIKAIQPICYCFLDDGEHKAVLNSYGQYIFPSRLHHHAILAIHPDTLEKMQELIGENTLLKHNLATHDISKSWLLDKKFIDPNIKVDFLPKDKLMEPDFNKNWLLPLKIMTSDIKVCNAGRLLYSSKMLRKFPDFMMFPDSFQRHRNKVSH